MSQAQASRPLGGQTTWCMCPPPQATWCKCQGGERPRLAPIQGAKVVGNPSFRLQIATSLSTRAGDQPAPGGPRLTPGSGVLKCYFATESCTSI